MAKLKSKRRYSRNKNRKKSTKRRTRKRTKKQRGSGNRSAKKKDPQLLVFISSLIESFYNDLSIKNNEKLNHYFYVKSKILKQINEVKKFNLDKNNLFISLLGILKNES